MDFVNKLTGNKEEGQKPAEAQEPKSSGGGIMDKLNGMAGGGRESEKNEDALDKGTPFFLSFFLALSPSPSLPASCAARTWG